MKRIERWRWWMIGGAPGLFVVLLLSPATGWIVRGHLRLWGPAVSTPDILADLGVKEIPFWGSAARRVPADTEARDRRVAKAHPNDYPINLAVALRHDRRATNEEAAAQGYLTGAQARVSRLIPRFPNEPAVYADALRFSCQRSLLSDRDENYLISGHEVPPKPEGYRPRDLSAEQFAHYDDAAATGELLDPDNAYFPMMRAVGLLEAHRDEEALAALKRAGAKHGFDDYVGLEAVGDWRIIEESTGDRGSLVRLTFAAAVLLPHYSQIRSLARIATYKAIEAERAGRTEEGFGIRSAEMHAAALMRARSRFYIGSLVAIAMEHIAISRPGGTAPAGDAEPADAMNEDEARREARVAEEHSLYCRYLADIGHPGEAEWAARELAACEKARAIGRQGIQADGFLASIERTAVLGLSAGCLFVCALWMLMAAGVATVAARSKRVRIGAPMPRAARWGAAVGVGLAVGCTALAAFTTLSDPGLALLAILPPAVIAFLARSRRGSSFWSGMAIAAIAMGMVTVPAVLMFLALRPGLALAIGMADVVRRLTSGAAPVQMPGVTPASVALAFSPMLLVPMAALTICAVSWRLRVPASAGLARGFRGLGVPLACLLVLPYGCIVASQARAEARENASLARRLQNEGRELAAMVGAEWPGVTRPQ